MNCDCKDKCTIKPAGFHFCWVRYAHLCMHMSQIFIYKSCKKASHSMFEACDNITSTNPNSKHNIILCSFWHVSAAKRAQNVNAHTHGDTLCWAVCLGSRKLWWRSLITVLRFWCHSRNGSWINYTAFISFTPAQSWKNTQPRVRRVFCRRTEALCLFFWNIPPSVIVLLVF